MHVHLVRRVKVILTVRNQDNQNIRYTKNVTFSGHKVFHFLPLLFTKVLLKDTFSRARYIFHSNISHCNLRTSFDRGRQI